MAIGDSRSISIWGNPRQLGLHFVKETHNWVSMVETPVVDLHGRDLNVGLLGIIIIIFLI